MESIACIQPRHEAGVTILFHGGAMATPHDGMFLSTDCETAADYGPVSRYAVRLGRVFDSTDPSSIEPLLPMEDPYDGAIIETVNDYMDLSGDTWERVEEILDQIDGDSVLVTEGSVVNYLVRDASRITLLPEPQAVH